MSWPKRRLKDVAEVINGFPFGSDDFSDNGGLPLVRIRDILSPEFTTFVPRESVPPNALIQDGDVVVGMDGDFNSLHWARGVAALNQRLCIVRANDEAESRFLAYAMPRELKILNDLTYSTTVKHLSSGQVSNMQLPLPHFDQQVAIADYLDRETAQIDTLIAKQEQLIVLLRERKSATVSSAIYFGLGSDVQLRHIANVPIESGLDTQATTDGPGDWPRYVRTTDIVDIFTLDPEKRVAADPRLAHSSMLAQGDILMSRAGSVGKCYLHSTPDPACYAGYLVRLRTKPDLAIPRFVAYWTQSRHFLGQIHTGTIRSTIYNYSASKYQATRIPLPPLDEQRRIVAYLDEQTAKIDTLIAKAERFIELAKERRAALITAAVTGQLDVTAA